MLLLAQELPPLPPHLTRHQHVQVDCLSAAAIRDNIAWCGRRRRGRGGCGLGVVAVPAKGRRHAKETEQPAVLRSHRLQPQPGSAACSPQHLTGTPPPARAGCAAPAGNKGNGRQAAAVHTSSHTTELGISVWFLVNQQPFCPSHLPTCPIRSVEAVVRPALTDSRSSTVSV